MHTSLIITPSIVETYIDMPTIWGIALYLLSISMASSKVHLTAFECSEQRSDVTSFECSEQISDVKEKITFTS